MSRFLLDVNVLIALVDADHVHHDPAHNWFVTLADAEWLTCPITQNGAVRVVSGPKYVNGPVTLVDAVASLRTVIARGSHVFVPDEISLLDNTHVDIAKLTSVAQFTDTYLIALATHHRAKFVIVSSVKSPHASLLVVV